MMFARIRRAGALASLVAALGFAAPTGVSAAVPGQPTAVTVNPEFAARVAGGSVGPAQASGVQEAQSRRQIRRNRAVARRNFSRQRVVGRNRIAGRGRVVRPGYGPRRNAYNRGYRAGYRNGARHYYGGRWYTYRDNYWYDNGGAIVAAGAIGLVAGALIGGAYDNTTTVVVDDDYGYGYGYGAPYSAGWYRACSQKYRSFRASDGTFLGYDGLRRTCRLP